MATPDFEVIPDPTDVEFAPDDEAVVDVDADIADEVTPTAEQSLRYYGVDFDVEGLVRRFDRRDLIVPSFDPAYDATSPVKGFQRRFVWPKRQMDRFIESLLLGYPVPGIFLVEEANRRFLVLDGQQRIRTLAAFYDGKYGDPGSEKVFRLDYVADQFRGLRYENLDTADRRLLDSTVLQSTIVVPTGDDTDAIYRVFERINSSGIKLQPQEIRVALYSGPVIGLLRDLNALEPWRAIFGPPHSRLKDHELILRYLAMSEYADLLAENDWDREAAAGNDADGVLYRPSMVTYLNSYLQRHRTLGTINPGEVVREFRAITTLLREAGGRATLRPTGTQVNAAHADAVLVGLGIATRYGTDLDGQKVKQVLAALNGSEEFRDAVVESTSHVESVTNRLRIATQAFLQV